MKTNTILLWVGLMALTATPGQAEDAMYLHTHKGTKAQAQNTDTNFGSPAEYNSYNRYRRNYEILLSADGVDSPGKLTVERRAVANFEVRNTSDKELVLLIGDDRAIAESTQLIAAGGNAAALDFHARHLLPRHTLPSVCRFAPFPPPTPPRGHCPPLTSPSRAAGGGPGPCRASWPARAAARRPTRPPESVTLP